MNCLNNDRIDTYIWRNAGGLIEEELDFSLFKYANRGEEERYSNCYYYCYYCYCY